MRVAYGSKFFQEVTLEWAHGRCAWFALAASARWNLPLVGFLDETGRTDRPCRLRHGLRSV